jgi:hypothetical protein
MYGAHRFGKSCGSAYYRLSSLDSWAQQRLQSLSPSQNLNEEDQPESIQGTCRVGQENVHNNFLDLICMRIHFSHSFLALKKTLLIVSM